MPSHSCSVRLDVYEAYDEHDDLTDTTPRFCYTLPHMSRHTINRATAARFLPAYQGIGGSAGWEGKQGIVSCFDRLRCIQFDPLTRAGGTNPDLVLQSRIAGYDPAALQELLYTERHLVDGWDKMMSVHPVSRWPFLARERRASTDSVPDSDETDPALNGDHASSDPRIEQLRPAMEYALQQIRERGPLCSADFPDQERIDWWWAPARQIRAALDVLQYRGRIGVHHRIGTRKYYDIIERLIPQEHLDTPDPFVSLDDYLQWRVAERVQSIGLVRNRPGDAWLGIGHAAARRRAVARLLTAGELSLVTIRETGGEYLVTTRDLPQLLTLDQSEGDDSLQKHREPDPDQTPVSLIAPLDNLIWDRAATEELFGFVYRWEVYKPQHLRQYGYYVMPVMQGDRFIARCEPIYERATGKLILKEWWWESAIGQQAGDLTKAVRRALAAYAAWCGAQEIVIDPASQTIGRIESQMILG